MATGDDWSLRWQEIEEMMRNLRSKEYSTTDPIDSSFQLKDLRKDSKERTLLIKVRLELYPISWEILDKIFSKFGMIEYLEVFCRGEEYHSTIRFQRKESAMEAFEFLNHRYIYDNWCRLELFLLSLIETPSLSNQEVTREQPMTVEAPMVQDSLGIIDREFKGLSEIVLGEATTELASKDAIAGESTYLIEGRDQVIDDLSKDLLVHTIPMMTDALKKPESNDDVEGTLTQPNCIKGVLIKGAATTIDAKDGSLQRAYT